MLLVAEMTGVVKISLKSSSASAAVGHLGKSGFKALLDPCKSLDGESN